MSSTSDSIPRYSDAWKSKYKTNETKEEFPINPQKKKQAEKIQYLHYCDKLLSLPLVWFSAWMEKILLPVRPVAWKAGSATAEFQYPSYDVAVEFHGNVDYYLAFGIEVTVEQVLDTPELHRHRFVQLEILGIVTDAF